MKKSENLHEIQFTLSLEEINKIFTALGKEPFKDVYSLIGKMNEQANSQLAGPTFEAEKKSSLNVNETLLKKNKFIK